LVQFLSNLLLDSTYELKNRDLHILSENADNSVTIQNNTVNDTVNDQNDTVNDTVTIQNDTVNDRVFSLILQDKYIKANEISSQLNLSLSTVRRKIRELKNNLLNKQTETLTEIAYESGYFDQNHFIKDFNDLVGITPKELLTNEQLALSSLFYKD
jgi:AraC-like DNA-binding protein